MSWEACGMVLRMEGLQMTDKFVLLVLAQYSSSETQMCWASVQTISEDCGCSANTVRRSIKELRKLRLIKDVVERAGHSTVYVLDYDRMDMMCRQKPRRRHKKPLPESKDFQFGTPAKFEGVRRAPGRHSEQVQIEPEAPDKTPSKMEDPPLPESDPLQVGTPPLPTCNPTPSNPEGVPLPTWKPNQDKNLDSNQERNQENNNDKRMRVAEVVFDVLREVPGIARATAATPRNVAELMAERPEIPVDEWVPIARSARDWCSEWKSMKQNGIHAVSPGVILRDYLSKHGHGSPQAGKRGEDTLGPGREAV